MGTFTVENVRDYARRASRTESATARMDSIAKAQVVGRAYDIFLSHSFSDAALVLGVKEKLEDFGHTVYVDWVDDPQLDRRHVSRVTAAKLRSRMNSCRSLFYATTENSSNSKWMPWECGYFDGRKNRVAILPITEISRSAFDGQEYLGLYPYITEEQTDKSHKTVLWVNESDDLYCSFRGWINGEEPRRH